MQRETRKYLYDVLESCNALLEFVRGKTLEDYNRELLLRSGVERQLMIVGEAMNQAYKQDTRLSESISQIRRIINLRNIIVHGYAAVENETVWGILQDDVVTLKKEVEELLRES